MIWPRDRVSLVLAFLIHLLPAMIMTLTPCRVEAGQETLTLDTRPGVTMKVLLMTPESSPSGVLVMFPGGDGKGHFTEQAGGVRLGGNFLVRSTPLFVDRGFVVAIIDVPSDEAWGMSDQFRTSREHTQDIQRVVDRLSARWPVPLFLVGTSRGTLSVAHLAVSLKDARVSGFVLTASIGAARGRGRPNLSLWDLPLEKTTLPVLLVHHRNDGCWASLFEDAVRLRDRIAKTSKIQFIEVLGGDPPRSEPCEAKSAHGFLGKEPEVVAAITDWALGRQVPKQIGP